MNGPLFHSGCPGAVHVDGSPSKRYCEGTGYDKKVYPWWKQCCIWDGKKCQRSKYCLFLLLGRLGRATSTVWQYGLWSFQTGGTNLERFLPKNQHIQRKLLNFENWVNGEVSKSAKSPNLLTFKVNFLCQKISESFSIFFSLKNINLGAHFLLLTFFDNFKIEQLLFLK